MFLPFPSFDEQRAIARVLGVLDDKIELNRRMNRTLEDLARAMFKSWFVDFDPVIAKAAGKKPVGMSAQTAALFPDRFQDSPLGPIPKGWRLGSIDSLCSLHRDQLDPAESPGEPFAHFSIPAFDNGREAVTEMGSAIKSGKLVIPDGSVMLSKLNPHVPRVWLPDDSIRRRRIASTEFLVCLPRCGITRSYLYEQFAAAPSWPTWQRW
ncbi:MAG: hypothetical protein A49_07350 [Methyloceanibacter sp.]|nr:MAG: hypothetical protein A49_07350 [Methyloceanibacter sp.]